VHTFDFVHKNIRPESVLLFPRETHAGSGGGFSANRRTSFLIGFEGFRSAARNITSLTGDQEDSVSAESHQRRRSFIWLRRC